MEFRKEWEQWAIKHPDIFESIHRSKDISELEKIINCIIKKLDIKKEELVLDGGCGSGIFASFLTKKTGCKVVGMDYSFPHVMIMRKEFNDLYSINGDLTNLPFQDQAFDKALCYGAIHYVKEWQKCILELLRVTKKGGKIYIGDIPDKSKKNKFRVFLIKKIFQLLVKPSEIFKKIKYTTEGPSWYWFDMYEIISFIENQNSFVELLEQKENRQYGTESYIYRVDLLITV